jgi:acyl-coenzyme A synthetase/AMP-(fatty) acid ligase
MPMVPEIAVALLAAIKIGGIILLLFSGYRPGAITSRLRDAGAKVMRHVIRAATLGQDPGDRSALASHEVVASIRPMTA